METQLWRKILAPYRLAVDELVVKFTHIKQQYQDSRMYSPIEMVSGRVKRVSSILEKAKRKGVNLEELEEKIEDIAGIRIICQFVEDIDTVVDIVRNRADMEVKLEKDYITQQAKWISQLSYDCLLYRTDGKRTEKTCRRDSDPYIGNELLVYNRAFFTIQIQRTYAG